MYASAVGYSGVLFGLIVVETTFTTAEKRSIFGFFEVPTKLYPIVLAILISLFMSNASLVGHICGIIAGFLCIQGWLNFLIPSIKTSEKIQNSRFFSKIYHLYSYAVVPNNDTLSSSAVAGLPGKIFKFIKDLLGCIFTCGRLKNPDRYNSDEYTPVNGNDDSSLFSGNGHTLGGNNNSGVAKNQNLFSGPGHKLNEEL